MAVDILVVSDTHGHMPINLLRTGCSTVFHAGDIGNHDTLNEFYAFDHSFLVEGNTDFFPASTVPHTIKTTIENFRFFMVHNLSAPHRIIAFNKRIIQEYKPHFVFFGHTHTPCIIEENDTVFINPGSLGKPGITGYQSYAMMHIDDEQNILVNIINIDNNEIIEQWEQSKK